MSFKLSIITINYNNVLGLQKTIDSVVNQTYREFEYIVIDGGSTDGSKELLEKQHNSIHFWLSEKDSGVYNAMNKGIGVAKGEYLLFLNSGDHFYNETILEEVINQIKDYDLIYSNLEIIDKEHSTINKYPNELPFSYMFFNTLPHPATFIRKELFTTVGLYDENLKIVSDWKFFMLALYKKDCSYLKIETVLSTFYLGGISSQSSALEEKNKVRQDYFKPYTKDYLELNAYKANQSNSNKLLFEIEKSFLGKKIIAVLLRMVRFLFSKKQ